MGIQWPSHRHGRSKKKKNIQGKICIMSLKRQRIDFQDAPKVAKEQKKRKTRKEEEDVVLDDVDNSSGNENGDEIAEDEEEDNFEGSVYYSRN